MGKKCNQTVTFKEKCNRFKGPVTLLGYSLKAPVTVLKNIFIIYIIYLGLGYKVTVLRDTPPL